ncbi:MAG: glycerophosphodiester phosphodiesterase [Spirochaetales bacterium]
MADRARARRWLIGAGIVAGVLFLTWMVARVLSEPAGDSGFVERMPEDRTAVIAHRGGAALWPENTMEAFRGARSMGVDVLEMDVFLSADGEPVVIHDETVDRTTDGSGEVGRMTVDELKELDAGYHFVPIDREDEYPYRGMGVQIPTLREVFEEFPEMAMSVELKPEDSELVSEVVSLVQEFDRVDNTLLGSFSERTVKDIREELPEVATAAVQNEILPFLVLNYMFVPGVYSPPAEAFFVPMRSGPIEIPTERFISNASRRNLFVGAWTINDAETIGTLIDRNIDALITDRPDLVFEALGSY